MVKRIEDMSPEWYLELQKDDSWIIISVHKDPDSTILWNSVQFCTNGSISPNTRKSLRNLFEKWEKSTENRSNIQTNIAQDVLALFIEEDWDVIISTNPKTVRIDFENMTNEVRQSLEELYQAILKDNLESPTY